MKQEDTKKLLQILEKMKKENEDTYPLRSHIKADELLCEALIILKQTELVIEFKKLYKCYNG